MIVQTGNGKKPHITSTVIFCQLYCLCITLITAAFVIQCVPPLYYFKLQKTRAVPSLTTWRNGHVILDVNWFEKFFNPIKSVYADDKCRHADRKRQHTDSKMV